MHGHSFPNLSKLCIPTDVPADEGAGADKTVEIWNAFLILMEDYDIFNRMSYSTYNGDFEHDDRIDRITHVKIHLRDWDRRSGRKLIAHISGSEDVNYPQLEYKTRNDSRSVYINVLEEDNSTRKLAFCAALLDLGLI